MKLSHLSLAILSAIALAACGGSSSDDHTTDPNANKPGATDQTPKQPEDKKDEDKKDETAKEDDAKIVDPTGDQVVDEITLAETSTTTSQQYLRGKASQFDRVANPSEPASATVLSGITLDKQNPQLTNIVIGRIDGKNGKGERVQVAFYAGSNDSNMNSIRNAQKQPILGSLQYENAKNALVGGLLEGSLDLDNDGTAEEVSSALTSGLGFKNAAVPSNLLGTLKTIAVNPLMGNYTAAVANQDPDFINYLKAYRTLSQTIDDYNSQIEKYRDTVKSTTTAAGTFTVPPGQVSYFKSVVNTLSTVRQNYEDALSKVSSKFKKLGVKLVPQKQFGVLNPATIKNAGSVAADLKAFNDSVKTPAMKLDIPAAPSTAALEKYGAGLLWFTMNGDFSKSDTGWGDHIDLVKGVVGDEADGTNTGPGAPTTGLVGIYKNGDKWVVRGSEANNVRTTRIFGHYYRDPGSEDGLTLNPEGLNSWNSARTFITGLDAKGDPNQYGLGAAPITLNHVQYGRVTATIDDNDAAKYAGTSGWLKKHQDFANRDPKYANDADDFYFYRGTNATSIEDMAKLPTDATIAYQGHALMYGIDNSFHGGGQELPNAFGNQQSYGLGNFVKANLNMGSKKFDGYVYNVWGSPASAAVKEDKLVEFSGDVTGNTVVGTANLAYDTSKTGDLRASFYGAGAEEVGGAINSVKREDPYGPIGWGGVFGAQRTTSGNSAWLVSSEKK